MRNDSKPIRYDSQPARIEAQPARLDRPGERLPEYRRAEGVADSQSELQ